MGSEIPKQFLPLGPGSKPVLVHTVEKFMGIADRIVIVLPEVCADASALDWVSALPKDINTEFCFGGNTRFESVMNALNVLQSGAGRMAKQAPCSCSPPPGGGSGLPALHGKADEAASRPAMRPLSAPPVEYPQFSIIAVHDGVRPLVSRELIERAFAEAELHGTAIPYITPVDSFRLDGKPVDRRKLMAVQTPQAFRMDILANAYGLANNGFTDDASVVEAAGYALHFFEGERLNIKITTPHDLITAEALCE
jgi:2-C-methyl-D-erythritol 4-phosphate cytidylyltransferase